MPSRRDSSRPARRRTAAASRAAVETPSAAAPPSAPAPPPAPAVEPSAGAPVVGPEARAALHAQTLARAPYALILVDSEGKLVECNRAALRLPLAASPTPGQSFVFLWPRSARPKMARWLEQLDEEPPKGGLMEVVVDSEAGEQVLEIQGWLLDGPQGERWRQVLARDITERTRLAQRALHAERLATVGRLAATLAHEVRNTLAGVDGALQNFQSDPEIPAGRREIVAEMRERIDRTRDVVADLLDYARTPRLVLHPWPVETVLEALRDAAVGHPDVEDVAVRTESGEDETVFVRVDAFHLRLVGRNLILNAAQAMGGRGEVVIRAARQGGEVLFRFEDGGPGVPAALREKVFEPFFTSRPGGTGLGLPIAANIVVAHGGRLYVDHGDGANGRFVLALPVYDPTAEPDAGPDPDADAAR